jgi:hypothetical protein
MSERLICPDCTIDGIQFELWVDSDRIFKGVNPFCIE